MSAFDTVAILAQKLALSLRPLNNALESNDALRDFLDDLGWDFDTPPAGLQSLTGPISAAVAFADVDTIPDAQIQGLLTAVANAFGAIADLGNDSTLPDDFRAAIPTQLTDALIVDYLLKEQGRWGFLLYLLGIIDIGDVPAQGARIEYILLSFNFSSINQLFSDPVGYLKAGAKKSVTLVGSLTVTMAGFVGPPGSVRFAARAWPIVTDWTSNVRVTGGLVPANRVMARSSGAAFWRTVAEPSGSSGAGVPAGGATSVTTGNEPTGAPPPQFAEFWSAG